jgi:CDP-6-deoxy-D-xylo-4-hexulose-3-dehydrase
MKKNKSTKDLRVPYAQAVYGKEERGAVQDVLKSPSLIVAGKRAALFEASIAALFAKRHGVLVNSGSSANLLAFAALALPFGSEVITPALTFSTTVAPLLQCGLVPVFADVVPGSYTINIDQVEKLVTKKTRALMVPSLLGNVPDYPRLQKLAKKHRLVLVEDSCDTVGATIGGESTGAFTDISTTSFYASHIVTAAGEGGMLCTNDSSIYEKVRVLSGWGRQSALNESENIAIRYQSRVDSIPYDAKFIFSRIGYNVRTTDISAAFGLAQLKKLKRFASIRRKNFASLLDFFRTHEQFFVLPSQAKNVKTSWLAFPLTIRSDAPFSRLELVTHLEKNNIQTRPIFTGNILRQPGFKDIPHRELKGGYPVADDIMKHGFVVGCHHGLTDRHIRKIERTVSEFLKKYAAGS